MKQLIERSDASVQKILDLKYKGVKLEDLTLSNEETKAIQNIEIDHDVYSQICAIMSDITEKQISFKINSDECCTNGKEIFLPQKLHYCGKTISDEKTHYTCLEHELSHILFESDVSIYKLFNEWIVNYLLNSTDPQKSGTALSRYFRNLPLLNMHLKDIETDTETDGLEHLATNRIKAYLDNLVKQTLNILEDHRVESNWGSIYPGSRFRFIDSRNGCSVGITEITNLENALPKKQDRMLASLVGNPTNVKISKPYEIQDGFFAVYILQSYITNHIGKSVKSKRNVISIETDDIHLTYTENKYTNQKFVPSNADTYNDIQFYLECLKSIENKSKNETLIQARNLVYHWNERLIINLLQFLEGNDGEEQGVRNSVITCDSQNLQNSQLPKTKKYGKKEQELFLEETDDATEKLRQMGDKRQEKIQEKINEVIDEESYEGTKVTNYKIIGKILDKDIFPSTDWEGDRKLRNPDKQVVSKLRKFFASIKSKNTQILDEEGDSLDPEAYIQFKANPNMRDIFSSDSITQG